MSFRDADQGLELTETFSYDGFGRLTNKTDVRGTLTTVAMNERNEVINLTLSESSSELWSVDQGYDEFGRLILTTSNGIHEVARDLTADGLAWRIRETGLGDRVFTYDDAGRPVWLLQPDGTQSVHVWDSSHRIEASARIRNGALTTTIVNNLDEAGHRIRQSAYSDTVIARTTERVHNGIGHTLETTNPDGRRTVYNNNLLGWPLRIEQDSPTPDKPDITRYTYNSRGQVIDVLEPGFEPDDRSRGCSRQPS